MFVDRTGLVRAPNCCVLLLIFGVFFYSYESLGRQPKLFVVDEIENAPKNDQNVVPNQSTVLLGLALFESSLQTPQQRFALRFAGYADFPQGLEAMPCRDEPLILGDFHQCGQVLMYTALRETDLSQLM